MVGHVGHDVDASDDALTVDEERMPSGVAGILVVDIADHVVRSTHRPIHVAEQRIVESLGLGELEVLGGRIEGSAHDRAVGQGELLGAVTQRLSFDRSTGGRGLRIPPQQHPPAAIAGQAHVGAVLIGKAEVGSVVSGTDHVATIRPLGQNPGLSLCVSSLPK